MAVYLIHSTVPLTRASGREVRHYLGYTPDGGLEARIAAHRAGRKSARVVQEFLRHGAELIVGNYWEGLSPLDERRMKRNGHLERKCLQCQANELMSQLADLNGTDTR
jgi:hypothetical protein